jgi:hypothetical protein
LTSEEEKQYRETPTSLFDASAVRNMALEKNVNSSSQKVPYFMILTTICLSGIAGIKLHA